MRIKGADIDRARGVRRAYTLIFLLMMELVEELGSDRALEMLRKAAEKQAKIFEKELSIETSSSMNSIDRGFKAYRTFMEGLGAEVEVHKRGEAFITLRVERCPLYGAMIDAGVECGDLQGGLCANLILPTMQKVLERIDPGLRLRAKLTRQSIDDFCLEEIYLES